MTSITTATLHLDTGRKNWQIDAGQGNRFKAKKGERYKVIKRAGTKEQLLDDVIAKKTDDSLTLLYSDGTTLTLENFFTECQDQGCSFTLPGSADTPYVIDADSIHGATSGEADFLVYAHGSRDVLLQMALNNPSTQAVLGHFDEAVLTYKPPEISVSGLLTESKPFSLLAGGGLAAAVLSGGPKAAAAETPSHVADNYVAGLGIAGPVISGHGLSITLYAADGTVLGGPAALSPSGAYRINIGGYTGTVLARLSDADVGADYMDEATGQAVDLNGSLMGVIVAGSGENQLKLNALTTVAALKAGVAPVGSPWVAISQTAVAESNAGVANAFGLSDLHGGITSTVDTTGAANAFFTLAPTAAESVYGAILAALSGVDSANGGSMQKTIDEITAGLVISAGIGTLSTNVQEKIIEGAQTASSLLFNDSATRLTGIVSAKTAKTSSLVSIDTVDTDDLIRFGNTPTVITGTNAAGASVSLQLGGQTLAASVSGTTWSYRLTEADFTAMGNGGEVIFATAIMSDASSGTSQRAIVVNTKALIVTTFSPADAATGVAIDADIVVTFDETVTKGTGQIEIRSGSATGTVVETYDAASSTLLTFAGNTLTINPAASLTNGTQYFVTFPAGTVKDTAGNDYAGTSTYDFTTVAAPDTTAPTLTVSAVSLSADTGTSSSDQITQTARQTITGTLSAALSAGDILYGSVDGGSNWLDITSMASGTAISWVGANLSSSGSSSILFKITDLAGNDSSSSGNTSYVLDTAAPTVTAFSPADAATGVATNADIVVTFNETVTKGAGQIQIRSGSATGTVVETYDAASSALLTFSGNTLTINPAARLTNGTQYFVTFAAGTVKDTAGNDYAGTSTYDFTTVAAVPVLLSGIAAGSGGFVINGVSTGDRSGWSVSNAGDVNGDGLADLIVGAKYANGSAGKSYVVFGKTGTAAINLTAVAGGTGGFVINGESGLDFSGWSVSNAGDVNGDGLADLIVGANGAKGGAGKSYVVFGKADTAAIDLTAVAGGTGGFVINGAAANDHSGGSVASAGDVNGDGLADLIVGAYGANSYAGKSYVVFGKTGTAAMDLTAVAGGTGGFVINGGSSNDRSGWSVSSAGDVNGDGLADLIVGAFGANSGAGKSYVVFGKTGTGAIDLTAVAGGTGGFVINGENGGDYSGGSVASAGDVNGDGLADLIVGARSFNNYYGNSYVVFGKTGAGAIDLTAVAGGTGGFVITGAAANDHSGGSVASAGDVNGDGLADLIVGAHGANGGAGKSYVIFGSTTGAFSQTAVDQMGDSTDNTLTGTADGQTLVGGAGKDTLTGHGNADVLYGGAGDDTLVINASNITALSAAYGAGGNTAKLARLDGGSGIDTLKLNGAGLTFDLTAIANPGGSTPGSSSRIESIERIDLTGSGNNTLTLALKDVLDMAGMNSFNSGNGWGAVAEVKRHQLVVDGNAGDVVNAVGWGARVGTVSNGGNTYNVYNQGNYAQLLIDVHITQTAVI